jgi:2-C-methyl-D-erythritol 4-phosphate cytidylyltransferase
VSAWAIVVAAGQGSRFGSPKQYERLGGRRLLDWSLDAARASCAGVVLVVPPDRVGDAEPVDAVVAGGDTRSASVRAGLAAVPAGVETVVVHDAARPLAGEELFRRVIEPVDLGLDAAICAVPVTDTVKAVRDGRVTKTLDRRNLVAVQTPQAFRAAVLRRAHRGEPEATDDAALVEAIGGRVVVVPGEPRNLKVTDPDDLAMAEALLATSP